MTAAPTLPSETRIELSARDGTPLAAASFAPDRPPRSTVVIAPAMAVGQGFYARFAAALAREGHHALTFDYRGMGRSRFGRPQRTFSPTIRTWAGQDLAAVVDHARAAHPTRPVFLLGHSLGGQLAGILPNAAALGGLVTVATGSGYHGHAGVESATRRFGFAVVMPLLARTFGYFPGRRLGLVGDIPAPAALEWARWCLDPHYLVDDQGRPDRSGFRAFAAPVLALSFADDRLIGRSAVDDLHGWFTRAPVERRHLSPADLGLERVGHFGFFREPTLWPLVSEFLTRRAGAPAGRGPWVGTPLAVPSPTRTSHGADDTALLVAGGGGGGDRRLRRGR